MAPTFKVALIQMNPKASPPLPSPLAQICPTQTYATQK
jgi:predicted amidohydrolase